MKYKINNKTVKAKSIIDAINKVKDFPAFAKAKEEVNTKYNFTFGYDRLKQMLSDTLRNPSTQKITQILNAVKMFKMDLASDVGTTYEKRVGEELQRKYVEIGDMLLNFANGLNDLTKYGASYDNLKEIIKEANKLKENSRYIRLADSNIKTKDSVDYNYLLEEERKAVNDYETALKETTDEKEIEVLTHILNEEKEHILMLKNLQKGKVEFNDEIKGKYYFIPDDSYGQHGTDIFEIYLTKEEANKVQETRIYNNERGFLTKSYASALYYTQD